MKVKKQEYEHLLSRAEGLNSRTCLETGESCSKTLLLGAKIVNGPWPVFGEEKKTMMKDKDSRGDERGNVYDLLFVKRLFRNCPHDVSV